MQLPRRLDRHFALPAMSGREVPSLALCGGRCQCERTIVLDYSTGRQGLGAKMTSDVGRLGGGLPTTVLASDHFLVASTAKFSAEMAELQREESKRTFDAKAKDFDSNPTLIELCGAASKVLCCTLAATEAPDSLPDSAAHPHTRRRRRPGTAGAERGGPAAARRCGHGLWLRYRTAVACHRRRRDAGGGGRQQRGNGAGKAAAKGAFCALCMCCSGGAQVSTQLPLLSRPRHCCPLPAHCQHFQGKIASDPGCKARAVCCELEHPGSLHDANDPADPFPERFDLVCSTMTTHHIQDIPCEASGAGRCVTSVCLWTYAELI